LFPSPSTMRSCLQRKECVSIKENKKEKSEHDDDDDDKEEFFVVSVKDSGICMNRA
jgi:hypothetical protein